MRKLIPAFHGTPSLVTHTRTLIVASSIALMCASPAPLLAAPGQDGTGAAVSIAQNVDYIGPETGAALDLDFPVMVPSWVPGPFGGSPAVDAGGGYYSLYWMNAGGEPTFLQVTGQVGGGLPAGSPYDLNVQLFINAQVQGYGAIHDVTPAYDTVWWIAGGVLYKVESRNSSTDSLTLANSMIAFVPPSAPEPEPEPEPEPTPAPPVEEPDPVTSEPGSNGGGSTTSPPADVDTGQPDPETGTGDEPLADDPDGDAETATDTETDSGGEADPAANGDGAAANEDPAISGDGTGETAYSSDGTGGAQNLVVGGDGTGGTIEVIIPRRPSGQPTP